MNQLKMCDLQGQYNKIKIEIDQAIQQVIDQTAFIKGPDVALFEKDLASYLKVKHVIGCANGTDALQVSLMSLNLKLGDEVITSNFTFIATIEVIALLGLKPVIVDVDPETFLIDPDKIEKAISSRTRVIIPVHLFGQNANMERIKQIADLHHLKIVEDCAQSIGSEYRFSNGSTAKTGTIGDIGCTSFFPSKNLGCFGDGGAIYTNDDQAAEWIRCVCNHGMKTRYYYETLGVNSRLDTIQAAVLRVKLKYLDQYNEARLKLADHYDRELSKINGIIVSRRVTDSSHVYHQYTFRVLNQKREQLKKFLEEKGIPTMIYYPVPLHLQKAYLYLGYKEGDFPVTEQLCKEVLSIPMHTEMELEQAEYITKTIEQFFQ